MVIMNILLRIVGRKKRSPQVPFIQSYWVPTIYSAVPHTVHKYQEEVGTQDSLGRFLLRDDDEPNYSVISTDYTTYSVVYTCIPLPARVKKGIVNSESQNTEDQNVFFPQSLCGCSLENSSLQLLL